MTILGLRFGVDASALESKIMAELAVILLELSTIKQGMHMDKTELAANLNAVADQANKARAEIIAKLAELEAVINQAPPEVVAAFNAVKAAVQGVDDLIPDPPPAEG